MTIYYTLTFVLLILEMFVFGILVLPLPMHWRRAMLKSFKSNPVVAKAMHAVRIIFAFIFVLFIDTVNRLQRIEEEKQEGQEGYDFAREASLKATRFYAHRNLYLCGFTLFLSLILERTTSLVTDMLEREAQLVDLKKDSANATKSTDRLAQIESEYKQEIELLQHQIKELKAMSGDMDSLKKRAEQQAEEYNRILKERDALKQK
ncbi:B-cell receptor-associated protein 31-like-domain-containing protein [Syncephalastrum racemosum]|uniref:Endoplasmic reticulum transmembrane protein n=1 Tax=Syncephalastrum racemosum TaxID=13706 RepID=A0A1X2HSW0_SYNRA|nr:B-cell receptor-associated protein 31-like-domain-containing protein [Syncephalastrum racemosum]